jgi:signal transduction histidine kinase
MDSSLAPLIAQENVRPYFQYSAFYPAERAYTRMFAELQPNEVLVPSPLLTFESPQVLLHFQVSPEGEFTSPQVPLGNNRDLAETGYRKTEQIEAAARRLADLQKLTPAAALCAALPREVNVAQGQSPNVPQNRFVSPVGPRSQQSEQRRLSGNEQQLRQQAVSQAQSFNPDLNLQSVLAVSVHEATLRPLWMGDTLLLARRVVSDGKVYLQGCWLDWPVIREGLLEGIRDLLPSPALEPVRGTPDLDDTRCLAALPLRLVPGALPVEMAPETSPLRASLYVAWASVFLAVLIVGWVLWQAVALSERRGAFVSAVTHELRTPLTTFRLYTDLLSSPGALDEAKRGRYLETLRREADRLGHLVETVLAYARLEGPRGGANPQTIRLSEVIAKAEGRLSRRAAQGAMQLVVEGKSGRLPFSAAENGNCPDSPGGRRP